MIGKFSRLISILILSSLCMAAFCVTSFALEGGTTASARLEFLAAVGVMDEDVKLTDNATYSDIMSIIYHMTVGVYEEKTEFNFNKLQANTGNLFGNNIDPDSYVTLFEYSKYLVSVLGYDAHAAALGGYPYGYSGKASSLGILNGVRLSGNDILSISDVCILTYNALHTDYADMNKTGAQLGYSVIKGRTFLSEVMKIYKGIDIVNANYSTTLTKESTLKKGTVQIGDMIFYRGKTNADELIGYKAEYYYRPLYDSSEYELLAITPKNNETFTIDARYITKEHTTKQALHYTDKSKTKDFKVNISPVAYFIYNGKAYPDFKKEDLIINSGSITLIDNDINGVYDTVIVTEYKTIVFDFAVSQKDITLRDIFDSDNNITFNADDTFLKIYKYDVEASIEDLTQWDILSVVYSDKEAYIRPYIIIYVTKVPVGGELEEFDYENDEMIIGGYRYELSANYKNQMKKGAVPMFTAGIAGTFYLDIEGKVGGFKELSRTAYGYACKMGTRSNTIGLSMELKLYIWEEGFHIYKFAEKSRVDDAVMRDNQDFHFTKLMQLQSGSYTLVPQLVTFKLNDAGEIMELKTAENYTNADLNMKTHAENNNIFRLSTVNTNIAYRASGTFSGIVYPVGGTKVITVPADLEVERGFSSRNGTSFNQDQSYNIRTYDESIFNIPKVIVVQSTSATGVSGDDDVLKKSSFFVFNSFSTRVDSEGEAIVVLNGFLNGGPASLPVAPDFSFTTEPYPADPDALAARLEQEAKNGKGIHYNELEFGDVLQVGYDSVQQVNYIHRHYTRAEGRKLSQTSLDYRQLWRVVITGDVLKTGEGGNFILVDDMPLSPSGTHTGTLPYDLSRPPSVTIVNFDAYSIRSGTIKDVLEGDSVTMRIRETGVQDVVVYKELY